MTRYPVIEIEGIHVAVADCDWVLWGWCGCPVVVAMAEYLPTEAEALADFRDGRLRDGERLELMTHERYGREVYPMMLARCPHPGGQLTLPGVSGK